MALLWLLESSTSMVSCRLHVATLNCSRPLLLVSCSGLQQPLNYAGLTWKVGDGSGLLHSCKTSVVSGWWNIFHWLSHEWERLEWDATSSLIVREPCWYCYFHAVTVWYQWNHMVASLCGINVIPHVYGSLTFKTHGTKSFSYVDVVLDLQNQ